MVWLRVTLSCYARYSLIPILLLVTSICNGSSPPNKNGFFLGVNIRCVEDVSVGTMLKEISEDLGVTVVRLQLRYVDYRKGKLQLSHGTSPLGSFHEELRCAKAFAKRAEKLGIQVIINISKFHDFTGSGLDFRSSQYWDQSENIRGMLKFVEETVSTLDGYPAIMGYDFVSEPVILSKFGRPKPPKQWNAVAQQLVDVLTRKRSEKVLFLCPGPWGGVPPDPEFKIPTDDRVVLAFHFYKPREVTHFKQLTNLGKINTNVQYPGPIRGKLWDRERLKNALNPIIRLSKKFPGRVYLTEFGAQHGSDGADQYLIDVLTIMNKSRIPSFYYNINGHESLQIPLKYQNPDGKRGTDRLEALKRFTRFASSKSKSKSKSK